MLQEATPSYLWPKRKKPTISSTKKIMVVSLESTPECRHTKVGNIQKKAVYRRQSETINERLTGSSSMDCVKLAICDRCQQATAIRI